MKNKQDTIRISALSLMLTLAAAGATFTMGEFHGNQDEQVVFSGGADSCGGTAVQ